MVQPAKRFDVWRRLYTRFRIEPFPASGEGPGVSTTITPITDADALLRDSTFGGDNMDLSGAAGFDVAAVTVPDGKTWIVKGLYRRATIADSSIRMRTGGAGMSFSALGTADLYVSIPNIRLTEGGTIGMLSTGDVGDDAVQILIAVEEEDVF